MKRIGIIGGLAWPSTITYYRTINEEIASRLGGNGRHCAKLVISQTDFEEVERNQNEGNWDRVGELIGNEANNLKNSGADFFIIACNTVHAAYPYIMEKTDLPNIHIVDPVAQIAVKKGIHKVGLIGSGYTMDGTYFKGRLQDKYGVETLVPQEAERESLHDALYNELVKGIFRDNTKRIFRAAINGMADRGAEAIILGCTEFGLMIHQEDSLVQLLDTTIEHARAAAIEALKE